MRSDFFFLNLELALLGKRLGNFPGRIRGALRGGYERVDVRHHRRGG